MTVQPEGLTPEQLGAQIQAKRAEIREQMLPQYVDKSTANEYTDLGDMLELPNYNAKRNIGDVMDVTVYDGNNAVGSIVVDKNKKGAEPRDMKDIMANRDYVFSEEGIKEAARKIAEDTKRRYENPEPTPVSTVEPAAQPAKTQAASVVLRPKIEVTYRIPGAGEFRTKYLYKIVQGNVLALVCEAGAASFTPVTEAALEIVVDGKANWYFIVASFCDDDKEYTVFLESD